METFLFSGVQEFFSQYLLGGVVWQFQVVDTGVDGGVGAVPLAVLAHHSQARVQVSQAARRQRRAPCGKLKKRLQAKTQYQYSTR